MTIFMSETSLSVVTCSFMVVLASGESAAPGAAGAPGESGRGYRLFGDRATRPATRNTRLLKRHAGGAEAHELDGAGVAAGRPIRLDHASSEHELARREAAPGRRKPGEWVERAPERVGAGAPADLPAVDRHRAANARQVRCAVEGTEGAEDAARVEKVVGDQRGRVDGPVVVPAVVDDLDRGGACLD